MIAVEIKRHGNPVLSRPTDNPVIMFVACPISLLFEMLWTGP